MKKNNIVKEKKDFDIVFKRGNQYKSGYAYIYIKDIISTKLLNLNKFVT